MSIKITEQDIINCNTDIFGKWINEDIKINTVPFNHCIIENFLNEETYERIFNKYPQKPNEEFWKYFNPLEVKYTLDKFEFIDDEIKNFFFALSHDKLINKLKTTFNIIDLEFDPYLHGGGIHFQPRNGRLNMHLDYEKHPLINKQRRLNIIYYVNKEWNIEWNGDCQLWDKNMKKCIVNCYPKKNRAIIFETIEQSWHGVPERISCPENTYRKSLAYYYISPLKNKSNNLKKGANSNGYRTKAVFVKRPHDPDDERMNKLFKIRPYRRITKNDMNEIWPEWNYKIN